LEEAQRELEEEFQNLLKTVGVPNPNEFAYNGQRHVTLKTLKRILKEKEKQTAKKTKSPPVISDKGKTFFGRVFADDDDEYYRVDSDIKLIYDEKEKRKVEVVEVLQVILRDGAWVKAKDTFTNEDGIEEDYTGNQQKLSEVIDSLNKNEVVIDPASKEIQPSNVAGDPNACSNKSQVEKYKNDGKSLLKKIASIETALKGKVSDKRRQELEKQLQDCIALFRRDHKGIIPT
jgi:hypothetical protein